jgi:hypothetical protein
MDKSRALRGSATERRESFKFDLKKALGWRRDSSVLLGGFLLAILLIAYIWWPLAEEYLSYLPWDGDWWRYIDWLLIAIFLFMSLTMITQADLRSDARILLIGTFGGLVIESWGTQSNLWHYYTGERPPLWIIPAWPIASLSIDRFRRLLEHVLPKSSQRLETALYWIVLGGFYFLMLVFVWPTIQHSLTIFSLFLCLLLIASEKNHRSALLAFIAGAGLGYFLERWGTTRECWTYYSFQTPPLFAVLAHGMAAMAFWRANDLASVILRRLGQSGIRPAEGQN